MKTEELKIKKQLLKDIEQEKENLRQIVISDDKGLFSKLIGTLNKKVYGKTLTELEETYRKQGIRSPKNNIKYNFDENHLRLQKALIIELEKQIKASKPRNDKEYYGLSNIVGKAGKQFFIEKYKESPITNLKKIMPEQLTIDSIVLEPQTTQNSYKLQESETITTKTLKLDDSKEKTDLLNELISAKHDFVVAVSHLNGVKNSKAFAASLYEQVLMRIYKTGSTKNIQELKEKIGDQLNTKIVRFEYIIPNNHIKEIIKAVKYLTEYINGKETLTKQTKINIYDCGYTVGTAAKERIIKDIKKENPEQEKVTPYKDLKKYVKNLK